MNNLREQKAVIIDAGYFSDIIAIISDCLFTFNYTSFHFYSTTEGRSTQRHMRVKTDLNDECCRIGTEDKVRKALNSICLDRW